MQKMQKFKNTKVQTYKKYNISKIQKYKKYTKLEKYRQTKNTQIAPEKMFKVKFYLQGGHQPWLTWLCHVEAPLFSTLYFSKADKEGIPTN